MKRRELSKTFLADLKNGGGLLHPILERIMRDHTLMLAIRENYINIYYRGGNILRITWNPSKKSYQAFFDKKYNTTGQVLPLRPPFIKSPSDAATWVQTFPALKEVVDFYFSKHKKPEREFQQLVARENNCSTISNETEYFISDIEFADSDLRARFDILAIRWSASASNRKSGSNCRAALIEMKYGDKALGSIAGLLKHLQDIDSLISSSRYELLLGTMEAQFNQLDELGLLDFKRCSNGTRVKLSANPTSAGLKKVLRRSFVATHLFLVTCENGVFWLQ